MQMWVDYYQMSAPPGDLDVVIRSAVGQAPRQPPHAARPARIQDVSVGRRWPHHGEGALTGEVLIVIVGARCRRKVCGGGGGVV